MPSPERPFGSDQDKSKDREHEHGAYVRAARFPTAPAAATVYTALQDTIAAQPCDLSTYRFLLDQISHVAVLGQTPPADLAERLETLLAAGEPASLPPQISTLLIQRRQEMRKKGPWVEGHYRPGKRLS